MKKKKQLLKLSRKNLERIVSKELNSTQRKNTALLKLQLENIQKAIDVVAEENDSDLREHFLEHQNNIFIPILDEATGEKIYEAKNLDEYLAEFKDNYDLYDEVYQRLEESIDYERSLYFEENENDVLAEVDWAKRAAEIEAGGEAEEYDAEGRKKDMLQRGKEKVKGAVEKVKSAYKKGALYFFLKTVQMGLKAALAASKGIFSLIKKVMLQAVFKAIKSWATSKKKVQDAFKEVKEGALQGGFMKLMSKIMKPFMWIASKLTKDVEKQKELAPIILSIVASSLMLAFLWAMGGISIFGEATTGMSKAMTEVVEGMPSEEAAMMCITEGINYKNRDPKKQFLLEGCGIILQNGEELSNAMAKAVMKDLLERDIVGKINEATQTVRTQVQEVINDKLVQDIDTFTGYAQTSFDQSQEVIALMQGAITRGSAHGMGLDLTESGWSSFVNKKIAGSIARITAQAHEALPDVPTSELKAVADGIKWTHAIESVDEFVDSQHVVNDVLKHTREFASMVSKSQIVGVDTGGLTNEQVLRFRKLSGLLKS
tara:strand:- start:1049 stop:2680 length:1632 start_codon:yes stop_codon:yes gene_type:complete